MKSSILESLRLFLVSMTQDLELVSQFSLIELKGNFTTVKRCGIKYLISFLVSLKEGKKKVHTSACLYRLSKTHKKKRACMAYLRFQMAILYILWKNTTKTTINERRHDKATLVVMIFQMALHKKRKQKRRKIFASAPMHVQPFWKIIGC